MFQKISKPKAFLKKYFFICYIWTLFFVHRLLCKINEVILISILKKKLKNLSVKLLLLLRSRFSWFDSFYLENNVFALYGSDTIQTYKHIRNRKFNGLTLNGEFISLMRQDYLLFTQLLHTRENIKILSFSWSTIHQKKTYTCILQWSLSPRPYFFKILQTE